MLQWRREGSVVAVVVVGQHLVALGRTAPNTYGGSAGCSCQSGPAAIPSSCEAEVASQKLHRAPWWPCKSEQADLGERKGGVVAPFHGSPS